MPAGFETPDVSAAPPDAPPSPFLGTLLRGIGGCALIWIVCFAIFKSFPYIRPGADLVIESKEKLEVSGPVFTQPNTTRVAIFGTSKQLAGFIPAQFDQLTSAAGSPVESYNFGLPAVVRFLPDLERLTASGHAPNVILLTEPWPLDEHRPTIFRFLDRDQQIMNTLFPFRGMIRDGILFALLARSQGGLRAYYNENRASLEQVARDRGYYFIARQSHYAGNRLPDDFRLETDRPDVPARRATDTRVAAFSRFYGILTRYHIHCAFVPGYLRIGERAPADPADLAFIQALRPYPLIQVLGPDYFLYPNRLFSDPVHLNPEGASTYTRDLAAIVSPWLPKRQ